MQAVVAKLYKLTVANTSFKIYRTALIKENKFRASRYGVMGKMIDFGLKEEVETKQLILELLDFVDDVVDELGSREQLQHIHHILENGTGALKQLNKFEERHNYNDVVDLIVSEFTKGL